LAHGNPTMPNRLLALLPALALAACAAPPAAPPAPQPDAAACRAEAANGWIGRPADAAAVDAIRAATGAASARWLKPGDAMTMDYRGDRVNVFEDAAGRIERITCG
ncbi:MAG TPA: I78 family peptidase inhibitor, partial [Thermomonas sp.]|nr:I78 family peptidase inhibitor [Thermomonas sp.]